MIWIQVWACGFFFSPPSGLKPLNSPVILSWAEAPAVSHQFPPSSFHFHCLLLIAPNPFGTCLRVVHNSAGIPLSCSINLMSTYYKVLWRNNTLLLDELETCLHKEGAVLQGAAYCSASSAPQKESAACFDKQLKFPFAALTAMF